MPTPAIEVEAALNYGRLLRDHCLITYNNQQWSITRVQGFRLHLLALVPYFGRKETCVLDLSRANLEHYCEVAASWLNSRPAEPAT